MENIQLKTGFDTMLTNVNDDDDSKINMAALLTVFMENAMNTAGIYTKHSNRKIISSIDISMALKKEVFTFLESDNLLERANEIALEFKQEIEDELDEEDEEDDEEDDENENEDDEDEDDEEKDEDEEENEDEEFVVSTCTCETCKQVNYYVEYWKTWTPSNRIETLLCSSIKKIDDQFNL